MAKVTGTFPFLIDWMCPAFGIVYPAHPETTNAYARDPANKYCDTYLHRVDEWKSRLAHPVEFPLILTRPVSLQEHLPFLVIWGECAIEQIQKALKNTSYPVVLDLSSYLLPALEERGLWQEHWHMLEQSLRTSLATAQVPLERICCIQTVDGHEIGGIRVLPWSGKNTSSAGFLLEWISRFGLAATRVEWDRLACEKGQEESLAREISLTEFRSQLDQQWDDLPIQKKLMIQGTLKVLKHFVPETFQGSFVQEQLVKLYCGNILSRMEELGIGHVSFQVAMSKVEEIHADIASLLEIFSPFTLNDFVDAFSEQLTTIPPLLKVHAQYDLHSCAMASLGAVFCAARESQDGPLNILFGENSYFECIDAAERIGSAKRIINATEEDWKHVDLILAQFNPTVRRINFAVTEYQAFEYKEEKIAEYLHRALAVRQGRPLTIAIDDTLDFSNSPRNGQLLQEFEQEILDGRLNMIFYRSGLKFDMFGMDSYCGAPFFMINHGGLQWNAYQSLIGDPALQADRLSANWYALAYRSVIDELEDYTQQIFDNTRAVLQQIPAALYAKDNARYRVIPIEDSADATFVDIKIFGPLHRLRGELLVGTYLTFKAMEGGYPLLFRPGIGFHHPNLAILFGQECTTVRLTIGLDPEQVPIMVRCLERLPVN